MSNTIVDENYEAALVSRVLELAVEVQQIAAPTLAEMQRAAFVKERFLGEGLQDVGIDEEGNVYGRLPGREERPPLLVSAHLDTVFPPGADLRVRREADRIYGLGIGDNALGVAGLFGLLWALREKWGVDGPLGDVWLVGNVGEEGLGDLRGMRAVVDRFGDQVGAYIVIEGMALGQIYHQGLSVRRYRLSVHTPGGHSWVDHGRPSAVHELARLAVKLTELPLPEKPRTTLNVGVISGGISVNAIAAQAHLELDLRSEEAKTLADLVLQVEALVGGANGGEVRATMEVISGGISVNAIAAQAHLELDLRSEEAKTLADLVLQVELLVGGANGGEVRATMEVIGQRPGGAIPASHPLVRLAKRATQAQGVQPKLTIGSTDANLPLSRGLPAVCVGLTTGYGAHTVEEYINTGPLGVGLRGLVDLVEGAFEEGGLG